MIFGSCKRKRKNTWDKNCAAYLLIIIITDIAWICEMVYHYNDNDE